MSYSFVIPSNRPYHAIEPLLLSISKQTAQATELIIVRDHDATLRERNEYKNQIEKAFAETTTKLTIVNPQSESNFQVGRGASYVRNYGRKKVETPSMIFVDDDNTFDADFAERLAQQRRKHPDAIIVPTQYDEQWEIRENVVANGFSFWMCRPQRLGSEKVRKQKSEKVIGSKTRREDDSPFTIHHSPLSSLIPITLASSNCLSGPTKVFETYPFDEDIPFVYEDIVMTWQMSTAAVPLFAATDIAICHHHGKRSKAAELYVDTPSKAYYKGKHRIILVHTLGNRGQKFLFWTIGICLHTVRLILAILLYCPAKQRRPCLAGLLKWSREGIKGVISQKKLTK